jgi:succinoglycan biosynthesis transport protein ExoP
MDEKKAKYVSLYLKDRENALRHSSPRQDFTPALQPERGGLIEEYIRALRRHRGMIALCVAAGLVLSLLIGLNTMPVFRTRTLLDIRTINADFTQLRSAAPTEGGGTSADSDINLQTQIKLLQSDTLIEAVSQHFLDEPHPAFVQKNDLLSRMLRTLHMGGQETIPYTLLVSDTAQNAKVKALGLTRLVEVTCDSWDPQFAARFCNTLTSTFEQRDQQSRATEAQRTSEWLTRQAGDIRQRAEESQKKLEAAVGGNGLMLSQTSTTAGEDRLRELQEELVKAQADRMQKEAQVSIAHSSSPEMNPNVQDDATHRSYELKLEDLRGQIAKLVPPLTEDNPKVIHLRAEIREVEAGLEKSQQNTSGRQDNELSAAQHREQLLKYTYNAQVGSVSSDLQKAAQVSLIKREVESEQQLYQTLLQRAKEAGFASAMQAATIRIIDPAKIPTIPFSPRRKATGAGGLALGLILGIFLALYRDRHHQTFRLPGDAERFLNLAELGTIPVAKRLNTLSGRTLSLTINTDPPIRLAAQSEAIGQSRWDDDYSIMAEAYRSVTFSMLLSEARRGIRSYVITSPNSGEGKTTITTNLGIALSKSKLRVVLIDGDLRRPRMHQVFGIENTFGLRNILRGEMNLEAVPEEMLTHRTTLPNLSIIPAGESVGDVQELLHAPSFGILIKRLTRLFDVVLIDTPPMLHMADARIMASNSDGVILVFRAGLTTREDAVTARNLFDRDGVKLAGSILNGFDPLAEGKKNYYESYYRYQQQGSAVRP